MTYRITFSKVKFSYKQAPFETLEIKQAWHTIKPGILSWLRRTYACFSLRMLLIFLSPMIHRPMGELKAVLSTLVWACRGKSGLQAAVGTSYEFGSPLIASKFTPWPSKLRLLSSGLQNKHSFFPQGILVCVRISEKCWQFQSWLLCKAPYSNDWNVGLSMCASLYCLTADCCVQIKPQAYSITENGHHVCSLFKRNENICSWGQSFKHDLCLTTTKKYPLSR